MTSSSSAMARRRAVCAGACEALTGLPELLLERVAVNPAVVAVEDVVDVRLVDLFDLITRYEPERGGLAAAPIELPGVKLRKAEVYGPDCAAVLERRAGTLLAEDLPDHAASASMTSRTHSVSSREMRRNASRSALRGP
jgi:hypothetical protein